MKKKFGMWMAIICILVVGVSVTKMTREFVVSQGVDAAAIVSVMDTNTLSVAGASMKQALKNQVLPPVEAGAGADAGEEQMKPETILENSPAEAALQEPTVLAVEPTEEDRLQSRAVKEQEAVTSGEALIAEDGPDLDSIDVETYPAAEEGLQSISEQEPIAGAPKSPLEPTDDAIMETVKSPLNPIVNEKTAESNMEDVVIVYTAETFLERFVEIEESAKAIWQNVAADNHAANLAAAEQERVIWDSELNFVYSTIRSKMTNSETESLKVLEVEWLKERDLYAEKMAAKSPVKNAQNQNPAYTKALAQKTKERCYWLISEYDEILNREEKPVEVVIEPVEETKASEIEKESGKKVSAQTKK